MIPGVYRDVCRVLLRYSNATAYSVRREEGRAADMVGEIAPELGCLQGRERQSALLSRELAQIAARGQAEVGQSPAGWQGCASLVEWRRVGEHKPWTLDVGRLKNAALCVRLSAERRP
jgi:hypothetical protein